jgi:predicted amidophosphoribosyltransferase
VETCAECRGRELAFDHAWAPFAYDGVARRMVTALKSRGALAAARCMGREIAALAPEGFIAEALVPAPAHPRRHRRHGFNQAEAIAGWVSKATGLPVCDALRRTPGAAPQIGLPRRKRLLNARDSVRLVRGPLPSRAALIDDVYTTGATLDASARALRASGVVGVCAITFARAVRVGNGGEEA